MWKREAEESVSEWCDVQIQPATGCFEDMREPPDKEWRRPLEAGKVKKTDSPLKRLER